MIIIENKTYSEERALYALNGAKLINCAFEGEEDGESALKEANGIEAENCRFILRYPLWHTSDFRLFNCTMAETARAAIWYCRNGEINGLETNGIKGLRECDNIKLVNVKAHSPEFGWKCRYISFENCDIVSEYFLLDSENISLSNVKLKGKYSFQYNNNAVMENCVLDTKDAFWHAKNITVKNSVIKGEYLAWYSENITFINCEIQGTQPLCYCKGLKLINCTMKDCDLSFEYSEVDADINGEILSVKNPLAGNIIADKYGEIIKENSVKECNCRIETRKI